MRRTWLPVSVFLVASVLPLAGGCARSKTSFTQLPGFARWYAAHPPATEVPAEADRALLERHRPHLFLPAGHEGPIDFYKNYIAHGTLHDGRGGRVASSPDQATLNAWKASPQAIFVHDARAARADRAGSLRAVLYGRVDRETVVFPTPAGPVERRITFLTWHAIFRTSGIPPTVSRAQRAAIEAVGSMEDWHQLDNDTAVTLALDESGSPFAVTMQQHNGQRTWLLDRAEPEGLPLPADGRVSVDVAIGSNELYPHRDAATRRRSIPFPSAAGMRWLIKGLPQDRPRISADDLTRPARQIDYEVAYLPPSDAFYVFAGYLGARRRLPGREGPPGADFNTLPGLKSRFAQMVVSWWRDGSDEDLARFERVFSSPPLIAPFGLDGASPRAPGDGDWDSVITPQAEAFYRAWQAAPSPIPSSPAP